MQDLREALSTHFGYGGFRKGQEAIVRSVLAGRPTIAILPTGGGKSLCYQLPALLLDGTTVVVSPLVALMKDQVDALSARGIPATFVNSSLPESERQERQAQIRRGAHPAGADAAGGGRTRPPPAGAPPGARAPGPPRAGAPPVPPCRRSPAS